MINLIPDKNSDLFKMYTDFEKEKLAELEKLFLDWYNFFKSNESNNGTIIRDFSANDMSFDGFYPNYFGQRIKILYIAREGRGISGENYIEILFPAYKDNCIGDEHINKHEFHRRIFYLTYGFLKKEYNFQLVPNANDISPILGTKEFSFAFMNISKFSNENDSYQSDYEIINKSVELSSAKRNFIQEEIRILDPDIIITMNLYDYFAAIGNIKLIDNSNPAVHVFELLTDEKKYLVLDSFHFSAIKTEKDFFFDPIINVAKKYKSELF